MKELNIDCVDDGCEGFLRAVVNGQEIKSDCDFDFFQMLLDTLGYNVSYNNIEEEV